MRRVLPRVRKRVLSRFKRFWFYLCWRKQRGWLKKTKTPDIIWVDRYKYILPLFWAPTKNNLSVSWHFIRDLQSIQLWQWLEERCRKPIFGVWVQTVAAWSEYEDLIQRPSIYIRRAFSRGTYEVRMYDLRWPYSVWQDVNIQSLTDVCVCHSSSVVECTR